VSTIAIVLGLLAAGFLAFVLGVWRARSKALTSEARMHSRPGYYGTYVALWTVLPALVVTLVWATAEPIVIRHMVGETLPQSVRSMSPAEQ
jgi:phosphate transport system permease protein